MSLTENYSDSASTPPLGQAVPLGIQHVLAMFASNVTPSIIIAGAAGLAFGGAEQIYLIQMFQLVKMKMKTLKSLNQDKFQSLILNQNLIMSLVKT